MTDSKENILYTPGDSLDDRASQASNAWPQPQPLITKVKPEPYPVDALPKKIHAAVAEVYEFVKAPIAMIASSAIAAVSLATQAYVDIERAKGLHGPVSLFLLTIADSGERKSTVDGFFMKPLRDFEAIQAENTKPLINEYIAKLQAWEARCNGIKDKIRQLTKDNKPTDSLQASLITLGQEKPQSPRFARLIYADATPEALAYSLAHKWAAAGVVSAEAGIVFGSHGMGSDSVTRNLSQLNQLWDGNALHIDRKTSESFSVQDARLTMSLMIQLATLHDFLGKSGALARGIGFFARFLVSFPESTQGNRPFTDPPNNWPALSVYNDRITEILNQPPTLNDQGGLQPIMMRLSPEAKSAWIVFYNTIESELKTGGALYDVRDVASKIADNAVRLAAIFQVFEYGLGKIVCVDCIKAACRIASWYLTETQRFFAESALPVELANPRRLDEWLIEYCRRAGFTEVEKTYARNTACCGIRHFSTQQSKNWSCLIESDLLKQVAN